MLGLDAKTYMLMPDLDDSRDNRFQIIDMDRCCVYGIGECGLLTAFGLIGMVKNMKQLGMRLE
ncbi:hypothetical protein D3C71_1809750 [compost metagenome]